MQFAASDAVAKVFVKWRNLYAKERGQLLLVKTDPFTLNNDTVFDGAVTGRVKDKIV